MFKFIFKVGAFFVLWLVIGACMTLTGFGNDETASDFVKFVPMAASFFIVFFIPAIAGKGGK